MADYQSGLTVLRPRANAVGESVSTAPIQNRDSRYGGERRGTSWGCTPWGVPLSLGNAMVLTVERAWQEYHEPILLAEGAARPTIYTYRYAVRSWQRLGFGDLDVKMIRQSHVLAWRANTLAEGGNPISFQSRWACIRAILSTLVAEGLIPEVPRTPRLKRVTAEPKDRPTRDEVGKILVACDVATWPTTYQCSPIRRFRRQFPVSPGTFWRSLYAVAFVTALRRSDLTRMTWANCERDGIRITPQKTRRYRKSIWCPDVGGALAAALAPMRACHLERVFPCGFRGDLVAEQQREIAIAAGVRYDLANLQSFRRASLDAWCEADERAAELIAGHGLRMANITRRHYVSRDRQQARAEQILREAAGRFKLPADFLAML